MKTIHNSINAGEAREGLFGESAKIEEFLSYLLTISETGTKYIVGTGEQLIDIFATLRIYMKDGGPMPELRMNCAEGTAILIFMARGRYLALRLDDSWGNHISIANHNEWYSEDR